MICLRKKEGGKEKRKTRHVAVCLFVCLFVCLTYIDATVLVWKATQPLWRNSWSFNTTTRYWTDSSEFWKPIAVDSCSRFWFYSSCCWMLGSAVQYESFILIQDYWSVRRGWNTTNTTRGRLLIFGDHPPAQRFSLPTYLCRVCNAKSLVRILL